MSSETPIVHLTVRADESVIVPVRDFVRALAESHAIPPRELAKLELLTEEVCLYLVENSFDPDEEGEFTLTLRRRPNQLVLITEDRGLPMRLAPVGEEGGDESQVGLLLMRGSVDEMNFSNLGKQGKRIEFLINLPIKSIEDYISDEEKLRFGQATATPEEPEKATDAVTLRLLRPDDALNLSRCIYRSYGYSYGNDLVYYPDKVVEALESGRMVSCAAVNEAGEIIGHLALLLRERGARAGETAMAVVDPRYRGRKLFEQMKGFMGDYARQAGIYGLYSEAVAVHPITQKGNLALGAHESGILLGYSPKDMVFKKIREEAPRDRQTAVLFHLRINPEPERPIYAPSHHRAVIETICRRGALQRTLVEAPRLSLHDVRDIRTILDLQVRPEAGRAFLLVREYGADVLQLIHSHLKDLCLRQISCIYLDLPLQNPMTAVLCKALESFGFFFAGVIFELVDGDALRLQYLNNVAINPDEIATASDFGRELLAYALAAQTAVGRRALSTTAAAPLSFQFPQRVI